MVYSSNDSSVTNIVYNDDALIKSYTYDAYGNTQSAYEHEQVIIPSSIAYTGAVNDNETGLYYMNARYYDPETGRFISQDTYRGTGEAFWHLYLYCDSDPVNHIDPTGHIAANVIGLIIGAVIGAVGGYYLANWLAKKLNLTGTARNVFVWGLTALIGASAATIGFFIGPYIAQAWSWLSLKLVLLLHGAYRGIEKISDFKMNTHINVTKHCWGRIMSNVTNANVQKIINEAIRKGKWKKFDNQGLVRIYWKYKGEIIEIRGKVLQNKKFTVSDAMVQW